MNQALNNGLLVDPYDQKSIEEALLKLAVDKNLWLECRKHGLKNIHRFSWPEHCRNYLSHLEHCKISHPTTCQKIIPTYEEPVSESLRDVEDLSLRFSFDSDFKANGDVDPATRQKELIETFIQMSASKRKCNTSYSPGRRQALYIIATDCYDTNGDFTETLSIIIKNVMKSAVAKPRQIGFILLTSLSLPETREALKRCQINQNDFDALVCNSGSELYYPWRDLEIDEDYDGHIAYRWPQENVRSTIKRIVSLESEDDDNIEQMKTSSSRCYTYIIKPGAKTCRVDDLRQRLRMRGFRCNTVFTHATKRLNVIPLFASRAQALRYLSVRWGIDLTKMFVFVGEKGDTDYEDLLVGLQKIIILKGSVEYASEKLLRSEESFKKEDMVPQENHNIVISDGYEVHDISAALETLGIN